MYPLMISSKFTLDDLAHIRDYAESHTRQFGDLSSGFWDGRVINAPYIEDEELRNKLLANRNFLKEQLAITLQLVSTDPLYADTLQIVRWLPGYELQPHADRENPDGTPHPFPWREFASVTFVNDDFDGGILYFPQRDLTVKPLPGTSIIFPGNAQYLHGVTKITSGIRYTVVSFFTHDATRADIYDRPQP